MTENEFLLRVADYKKSPDKWIYSGTKPALICFYADWCRYCKSVNGLLKEVVDCYGDELLVYKIDTEKERNLVSILGIMEIPSFLFVPVDRKPQVFNGLLDLPHIREIADRILLPAVS